MLSMGCQEQLLIKRVCEIYDQLSTLENLNPSKQVNSLFTELVLMCTNQCQIDINKLPEKVQGIRFKLIKLCGQAEGLLESHFSTIIGSHNKPLNHLTTFPYYSNYLKLSQLEFSLLRKNCTRLPNIIAFVGSGPLPLSSIILATNHLPNTCFHNYDIDQSANLKAINLVSSDPDLSKRMFFHTANIMNVTRALRKYQVVFLAALVGANKEDKTRVINHLAKHLAPGAYLVLRSAHEARAFLYPEVDLSDLRGFDVLSVFHPTDEVINSVIVARKCAKPDHFFSHDLASPVPSNGSFDLLGQSNMIQEFSTVDEAGMCAGKCHLEENNCDDISKSHIQKQQGD